jgi:hypothetical protein
VDIIPRDLHSITSGSSSVSSVYLFACYLSRSLPQAFYILCPRRRRPPIRGEAQMRLKCLQFPVSGVCHGRFSASGSGPSGCTLPMYFVPTGVTTFTEKLVLLPARPHSNAQNTYVGIHTIMYSGKSAMNSKQAPSHTASFTWTGTCWR